MRVLFVSCIVFLQSVFDVCLGITYFLFPSFFPSLFDRDMHRQFDRLIDVQIQHSDTVHSFVNCLDIQPFVVKLATENTILMCHGSGAERHGGRAC